VRKAAGALILLLSSTGCVPSLQPLFIASELLDPSQLAGSWQDSDGETAWVLRSTPQKELEAAHTEKGESHLFKIRLGRIGRHEFLDLEPAGELPFRDETYKIHHLPVHTFYKIVRAPGAVRVYSLSDDALKRLQAARKAGIGQIVVDAFVFTGSSAQLREFLLKNGDDDSLFMSPAVFTRVP
jgi:hypothetical protein